MLPRQFDVIIERNGEGYYVASVPQLPACHTQARSLEQPSVQQPDRVEAVEGCERARWGDLEDRAITGIRGTPRGGCPIETSVAGLNQRAIGAGAVRPGEVVQGRQRARTGNLEDCAAAASRGPAGHGRPIEVPVHRLR